MHPSSRMLQACRITLFTRANCGLCSHARSVLSQVWDSRPFAFKEVDIIDPKAKAWRDVYEFDVPVIHISKAQASEEQPSQCGQAVKLMHRFTPDEVKQKMDHVETA